MTDPIVQLIDVDKRFATQGEDVVALDAVSLTIHPGEFVCLHGASGSGKTTLLNATAGLETVDSGQIIVDGVHLEDASEAERARMRLHHVGIVFQDDNLIPELTASENIELPLEALHLPRDKAKAEALRALGRVGIAELADRRPPDMSGGQRQRVGIARALTGGRKLLLADEPTGALDSVTSRHLFELLRDLSNDGHTVVMVTHDLTGGDYASRTLRMVDGRLSD